MIAGLGGNDHLVTDLRTDALLAVPTHRRNGQLGQPLLRTHGCSVDHSLRDASSSSLARVSASSYLMPLLGRILRSTASKAAKAGA